jgi:TRAP-type C4-dicarboxylate transport system permease small subunit
MRTAVRRLIGSIEELGAAAALVAVVLLTVGGIVNRYLLEGSAAWLPELSGILFAWVVFLGAGAAWKRGMHIAIDAGVRYLPVPAQAAVRRAVELLLIAFLAYALYLSVAITISSHARVTPVLRIPFSWVYAAAAAGFALMLLRKLAALVRGRPLAGEA